MKNHLAKIIKGLKEQKRLLFKDRVLKKDIDILLNFIPPYSKAINISDIKLIIIGQDPTVRNINSRQQITATLNLDKENSLKCYLKKVCDKLDIDIKKEVYASNLYKCFFKIPPAADETILSRHFKYWMDFLIQELEPFENTQIITLGEPLIKQLIHSGIKRVKHYWNYIGNTKSNKDFKFIRAEDNYLQKRIYPLPHQPTWNRNKFYRYYFNEYLAFIKRTANKYA